jgi:hypothetical protein
VKKVCKAIVAVLLLTAGIAPAQDQPKQPLSPYMRKTGILYLDQLDDFKQRCERGRVACETVMNGEMNKAMGSLEDNVTIDLDEPGRPAGDSPYFLLLKRVRQAEYKYLGALSSMQFIQHEEQATGEPIASGGKASTAPFQVAGKAFIAEKQSRWNHTLAACYVPTREMAKVGSHLPSVVDTCGKMILKSEDEDTQSMKHLCEISGSTFKDGECHAK